MNNKEKAKKIATDVHQLAEWMENMPEEEGLYPVSFFSEAADRLQTIQRELQSLEAGQSELITLRIRQEQIVIEAVEPVEEELSPIEIVVGSADFPLPDAAAETSAVADTPPVAEPHASVATESAVRPMHEQYAFHRLADFTRSFNLNDRIRFRKDLFLNDEQRMNQAWEVLNACATLEDSLRYLRQLDGWPPEEHETAQELVGLLKQRFS